MIKIQSFMKKKCFFLNGKKCEKKKKKKRERVEKLKKVELFSSLLVFTVGPIGLNVLDVEHEKRLEHVEVAA